MKKHFLFFVFAALSAVSFAQTWTAGTGLLYANPTTTKVGIGTSVPLELLHVSNPISTSSATAGIRINTTNPFMGGATYCHWNINSTNSSTTNISNLTIKFGQAFIANSNPTSWMATYTFGSDGTLSANSFYSNSFNYGGYYLSPASTNISLKVAGKIQTCGKIEAEEIEVKNVCAANINVKMDNLADFVFNDDYNQMSLYDLEQFIATNKHLPGIPSAEEVKDKGMDVAEMNNLLLQKIEELTLYIIEQENRIKEIESLIK